MWFNIKLQINYGINQLLKNDYLSGSELKNGTDKQRGSYSHQIYATILQMR